MSSSWSSLSQRTKQQKENQAPFNKEPEASILLPLTYIITASVDFLFILLAISKVWSAAVFGHLALQQQHAHFLSSLKKRDLTCYNDTKTITLVKVFISTCWMLCTAELVSVSSPTMTVLYSVMVSCLCSVKSTYSSDSESSGSAWTLCFFLGCREDRLGLSWAMPSFSRVRVGWRGRWNISWQYIISDRSSNLDVVIILFDLSLKTQTCHTGCMVILSAKYSE